MIPLQPMLEPNTTRIEFETIDVVDILSISPCDVTYSIKKNGHHLILTIQTDVDLILACAKTLKPVEWRLSIDDDIIFGDDLDSDFIIEPEVDLKLLVQGLIVSSKPLVVYHPDSEGIAFEENQNDSIFKTLLED